jgi:DNA polymerase I-like protein with 3'-5' exonuclease and polymerase domains/uracil-DNA glycosylase
MPRHFEGPPRCQIAFVSDVPEAGDGRVFGGGQRKLLTRVLQQVGIPMSEIYFDTLFQKHPPRITGKVNDDIKPWLDTSKKYTVESQTYREALEALRQRLERTKATVIVPLGNAPLYALTGKKAITKRRGSILECTLLPDRKVIPTLHPRLVLAQYLDVHLVAHDLRLIVKQAQFPEIKLLPRRLNLMPSYSEILDYIRRCHDEDAIAYDIEVKNQEVSHLSIAIDAQDAIVIPFLVKGENHFTPPQEARIWKALALLLEDESVEKVGQNLTFDSTFLYRRFGIHVKPMHDTMVAHTFIYTDFKKDPYKKTPVKKKSMHSGGSGLDFIQSMYCNGEPYYKDDGKEWFKYSDGEETFLRYSAMDSAVVAEIWPQQKHDLKAMGNWASYERQMAIIEPLVFMGEVGVRMDNKNMDNANAESVARIKKMEDDLWKEVGFELMWTSPAKLKDYFYKQLKYKPYFFKKRVTTNDKALKRLSAKNAPGAAAILNLRHEEKLRGTYYNMQLDPDGRLRCSYNPVGTKQARISSSQTIFGTGGNLQNQPAPMKKLMLADPGMVFLYHDLSMAENRVVAYDSQDQRMMEAFENWIDLHVLTASMIYGKPIEEITEQERSWGKRANHGLNYDLGYKSFAVYYAITEDEARFIVERYHKIYPGVRRWHKIIIQELQRTRALVNLFGRKRIFLDRWGDDMFKEAYSYIPQSTVAEVINQGGIRYIYENQTDFGAVQLANSVHDSIMYQIPLSEGNDYIAEVGWAVRQNLERPLQIRGREFPIPVDTKIGFNLDEPNMFEIKAKNARSQEAFTAGIKEFLNGSACAA